MQSGTCPANTAYTVCFISALQSNLVTRRCEHKVPHLIRKIEHSCADLLSGCVHVFSTKYSHWAVLYHMFSCMPKWCVFLKTKQKKKKKKSRTTLIVLTLLPSNQISSRGDGWRLGQSDQQPRSRAWHHKAGHDHPAADNAAQNHEQQAEKCTGGQRRGLSGRKWVLF